LIAVCALCFWSCCRPPRVVSPFASLISQKRVDEDQCDGGYQPTHAKM
jgi:hypothetical protein